MNNLVAKERSFSDLYFEFHHHLYLNGDPVLSRNGSTRELLGVNTIIHEPLKRCVGGFDRNINIFFLLAEALWIFTGRRDVSYLTTFNSRMINYSDDGKNFHAPYGWRLRNYGVDSKEHFDEENNHSSQGIDQIYEVLTMLKKDPESRRAVMSIWNPNLDLNVDSKDLPCNDMVFVKIRKGQLRLSIANRSNDIDWGLTTNVFQFSFIGEVMSSILNIPYGTQEHKSDSLHMYTEALLTNALESKYSSHTYEDFYKLVSPLPIEFNFPMQTYLNYEIEIRRKLYWIDFFINSVIINTRNFNKSMDSDTGMSLKEFCPYLFYVYKLLRVYVEYKEHKEPYKSIDEITTLGKNYGLIKYDFYVLALNFFIKKVVGVTKKEFNINSLQWCFPTVDLERIKIGRL